MICKVRQTIDKYSMLGKDIKTVALGLSGGADSVCLADVLLSLKDEYGFEIKAVHVNHNIRGEEAVRDEEFVKDFCKSRGLSLQLFSVDVPDEAKKRHLGIEECARQIRYECFEKAGCDAVAVAHTLSDSIETMIFNLIRGTGARGLGGINPKRKPDIIRPLIEITRSDVEKYCKSRSLTYIVDSTNLSDEYTRNHIRHNIIPAFERINSDFESALMRAMSSIREQDCCIEQLAMELLDKSKCEGGYKACFIRDAESAVAKKSILFLLKEKMKKPPEAKHVEGCYSMLKEGKGKIELAKDLYILLENDIISFPVAQKQTDWWKARLINGVAETPYGKVFLCESEEDSSCSFDAEKIKGELFASSRMPGDSFTLKKRGVSKSLKKLFNECGVPVEKRNKLAVLRDSENVIWVEDFGVNALYIPDENTQKIITVKKDG